MSDYAINLLRAIETSDKEDMDTAFADAVNSKIADALDAKKIEIAQNIYNGDSEEDTSDDEIIYSDDEVDELDTTETSEENGTEEV